MAHKKVLKILNMGIISAVLALSFAPQALAQDAQPHCQFLNGTYIGPFNEFDRTKLSCIEVSQESCKLVKFVTLPYRGEQTETLYTADNAPRPGTDNLSEYTITAHFNDFFGSLEVSQFMTNAGSKEIKTTIERYFDANGNKGILSIFTQGDGEGQLVMYSEVADMHLCKYKLKNRY